jgi:hypothetical protein
LENIREDVISPPTPLRRMKMKKKKKQMLPLEKTTELSGFHHVYPSNPLFERYIEGGRKEVVELYNLLPQITTGGYDALKYTITIRVETAHFDRQRFGIK